MTDIAPKPASPGLSLSDLNAKAQSDQTFKLEYVLPDGRGSGFFLEILGGQSERVTREVNRLMNERRRMEAARESQGTIAGVVNFTPVEDDISFGKRLTAARIVGWSGVQEPYDADAALALCQNNDELAAQVLKASNNMANFMKVSSPK